MKIKPFEEVQTQDLATVYTGEKVVVLDKGTLKWLCATYNTNLSIQDFYDMEDGMAEKTEVDQTDAILVDDDGDKTIYKYGTDGAVVYNEREVIDDDYGTPQDSTPTPFGLKIASVNLSPLFKDNVNELNYHIGLFNQEHEELEDFQPYQIIRMLEPADLETRYEGLKYAHIELKVKYMKELFQRFHEESHDNDETIFLKDTQTLYDKYFDDMQDLVAVFLFVPNEPTEWDLDSVPPQGWFNKKHTSQRVLPNTYQY